MFEARLLQGSLLKRLAEALKELVAEVNFNVNSAGMTCQAMDSSHVCLVVLDLKSDGFDHFRCDRSMNMGVNVANLLKALKCAGNDDIVTLKADDHGDVLTLMFESKKQDRVWDFDLKLLSIDSEALDVPEQDADASVTLPSSEYARICRDLSCIGETVVMAAGRDTLRMTTHGDVGTANVVLRNHTTEEKEEENVVIEVANPISATFALRYLNNFSKAAPLAPVINISLAADKPISVGFTLVEGHGSLRFFLAPKIEDDDDIEAGEEESIVKRE